MADQPNQSDTNAAAQAAIDHSPGAVPPTDGVPPRTGTPSAAPAERSASEDLADGLDLLRRAARKTLRSVDPRIEALAEQALVHLKELDDAATEELAARKGSFERTADEVGREILGAIERVSKRIESAVHTVKNRS